MSYNLTGLFNNGAHSELFINPVKTHLDAIRSSIGGITGLANLPGLGSSLDSVNSLATSAESYVAGALDSLKVKLPLMSAFDSLSKKMSIVSGVQPGSGPSELFTSSFAGLDTVKSAMETHSGLVSSTISSVASSLGDVGYTPKLKLAANNLLAEMGKSKGFRGLAYSNFIGNGVSEYSRLLKEKGVSHQVYTGSLSQKEKDEVVKGYNSGKIPVLIVSSSGAEGLDLKGTRLIQILDPHFNPSKIRQIVGRGVRYESHAHLPESDRKAVVQHYLSVHPENKVLRTPTSIEKYLVENSSDKQDIFDQVKKLMSDSSKVK